MRPPARPVWLPIVVPPRPRRPGPDVATRLSGRPPRRTAVPVRFPRDAVTRLRRAFVGGATCPPWVSRPLSTRPEPEGRGARLGAARLADPPFPSLRCCLAAGARRAGAVRCGDDARGAVRWGARWVWVVPEPRRRARPCPSAASIGADQTAIRRRLENTTVKRYMTNSFIPQYRRADTMTRSMPRANGESARNLREPRKTGTRCVTATGQACPVVSTAGFGCEYRGLEVTRG